MVLNSNPAAATQFGIAGGQLDWKTVLLHEAGHMAGLEHSCPAPFAPCTTEEAQAVMYYQYRGLLRHLEPDDIAGITALYPAKGSGTAPPDGGLSEPATVVLRPGWNLAVLPPISLSKLAEALGCVQAVYGWANAGWEVWIRGVPVSLESLGTPENGRGYWVHASGSCAAVF
jgi:hypothetical protein